jgi:hypothetical protein
LVAGTLGGVDEQPFRFEFAVPDDADVQEPPPEGKSVFDGEVVASPLLERLRAALGQDLRWSVKRVASLRPDDWNPSQRIVLWVSPALNVDDSDIRAGVFDIVTDVIRGASFSDWLRRFSLAICLPVLHMMG